MRIANESICRKCLHDPGLKVGSWHRSSEQEKGSPLCASPPASTPQEGSERGGDSTEPDRAVQAHEIEGARVWDGSNSEEEVYDTGIFAE